MNLARTVRGTLVTLTCLGFLTSQVAQAAAPGLASIRDVALQSSGLLQGQVLNEQGTPQAGVRVAAIKDGKVVALSQANRDGRFELVDLSGGIYQIQTAKGIGIYRVWAPRTAPPAAQDGVLLIEGDEVIRGQQGIWGHLASPWCLAVLAGLAIGIPLWVTANDDGS